MRSDQSLSHFQFFVTQWTTARQAPLSMGTLQARILEWVAMHFSRGSSQPRDQTQVSYVCCIGRQFPSCILGSHTLLHHSPNMKIWVLLDYLKESFPPLTGSLFHIYLILVILSHRHVKTSKCREASSLNFPYGHKDKSSERDSIVINPFPKSFIN